MAFLSIATLEDWVEQFRALGYSMPGTVRVIPQDGDGGADTGLVSVTLGTVSTKVYIQPVQVGSDEWCVTFEPRLESASLNAPQVTNMASELTVVASLCAFLESAGRRHLTADEA